MTLEDNVGALRVLLLAESCNPEWPSLPVVGYNAALAIADRVDAVVATHVRNRPALENRGMGRARVVYIDNEWIAAPAYRLSGLLRGGDKLGWTIAAAASYPGYLAFEWAVWRRFRAQLRAGGFDLVHRITPMSPTLPSPMTAWSPVPVVVGPLNGGLPWPRSFRGELAREREYLTYLRSLHRLLPFYRSTYRRAAAILAAFRHTVEDLPLMARDRIFDFPEVGIDTELFSRKASREPSERVTFLFVGRLVPLKCPDVALEAFASTETLRRHRLLIVGDGPLRCELEDRARALALGDHVKFTGWCSQRQVAAHMGSADVLVFPSIRELGAGAVVEAMACGCAPIVVGYGGPGELVAEGCGVRIPLSAKAQMIRRFATAMTELAADSTRRENYASAARQRALTHFSWAAKASKTLEIYEWVLGRRSKRPDFESGPVDLSSGNLSSADESDRSR